MTDRKQVRSVRLKDEDEGKVRAVVATMGAVDADGDIIEPGAFGTQDVVVSGFGHTSWEGAPPVGRGAVTESGEKAVADLEFFLDTSHGRDLFTTMKRLGELGEWSFGFDVKGQRDPTPQEREDGAVRILEDLEVHEVSPVLRGAGVDTGTLAAKCSECGSGSVDPDAARSALEAGQATLRKVGSGLRDGFVDVFVRQRDKGAKSLAEFTADVGFRLADAMDVLSGRVHPPKVKWMVGNGETKGAMHPDRHRVLLAKDLRGRELVHTVLHELKHMGQADPRAAGAEEEAEGFARRWAPAVKAACRATGGDAYKVHVRRGRPPWYDRGRPRPFRNGDVVLNRSDGRAYQYHPRNTGTAWTGLAT